MSRCRIINGVYKRRYISAPEVNTTRPTSDVVKQAVFNVLVHRFNFDFSSSLTIDLFAGSGSLGIEAISCGCPFGIFVDCNIKAINCIRQNIKNLGIENCSKIIFSRADKLPDDFFVRIGANFTSIIIFIDPPYSEKALLSRQITRFSKLFYFKSPMVIAESNVPLQKATHTIRHGNTFASMFLFKSPASI